jgi:hypothetical protein
MKILQRNLNSSTFVVWEMKRNVSVVRFKFRCNILISGKIIKEMPGSVASGTPCTNVRWNVRYSLDRKMSIEMCGADQNCKIDKTGKVGINVTLRRVRVTVVAVGKQ